MSLDWKYIYKRRGWTTQVVFNTLDQKTWEAFDLFHTSRGITCPPKSEFDKLLSSYNAKETSQAVKPAPEKKPVAKKKRTYTRKKRS